MTSATVQKPPKLAIMMRPCHGGATLKRIWCCLGVGLHTAAKHPTKAVLTTSEKHDFSRLWKLQSTFSFRKVPSFGGLTYYSYNPFSCHPTCLARGERLHLTFAFSPAPSQMVVMMVSKIVRVPRHLMAKSFLRDHPSTIPPMPFGS